MNFLVGLIAGTFGGLVGLGGGVLMIPLMVGVLKLEQRRAHGTSLVAIVFTGVIGASTYAFHGVIDVVAAILLAAGAVWPVRLGARLCHRLPEWKLKRAFGVFLIAISMLLVLKPYLPLFSGASHGWPKLVLLLLTGAVTGFLSGLMGVGGGAIMIAAMVLLIGYPQHTAQGSSLLAMVPTGAIGAFTHWRMGNVEKDLLQGLIPGIIIGTYMGGSIAYLLPELTLRIIFAAVLIGTAGSCFRTPRPVCDD